MGKNREHLYEAQVRWTGNLGAGTSDYRSYSRDHEISMAGKPSVPGSSDTAFRGSRERYSPEDLLVCSLSACHMLWYLHLCADAGIIVLEYLDQATGTMAETAEGGGRFTEVVLRPAVTIAEVSDAGKAEQLHERAHELCFIANSVNFPVLCEPRIRRDQRNTP
jgi:organic hydroperoxide reductase OsmC/OhrA